MGGEEWKSELKTLPWSVWLKTLNSHLMETKLMPNKLKALYEVDWPALVIG
jgi:hypothetical protein